MARQWRIEYSGALYHVLSRGNGRQDIFLSDKDRCLFLDLVHELSERFNKGVGSKAIYPWIVKDAV